jgi:hypothetical protein
MRFNLSKTFQILAAESSSVVRNRVSPLAPRDSVALACPVEGDAKVGWR